jgi:hypothetical protein
LGVNPLYYHLGIAQQYGVQTLAIAHFKGKLKVSVGKIYARRLGMCVGPNCNSRSKIDMGAILQRVNVVAP